MSLNHQVDLHCNSYKANLQEYSVTVCIFQQHVVRLLLAKLPYIANSSVCAVYVSILLIIHNTLGVASLWSDQ